MRVFLKCFAELARFRPSAGWECEVPEGETVAGLRERLGIPEDEVAAVFVNGSRADPADVLPDEGVVVFFPEITGG